MSSRKSINVSKESYSIIEAVAEDREIDVSECADQLIATAWGRIKAVRKDGKRRAKGLKPQHRKVQVQVIGGSKQKKTKKAKKAKSEASKANGAAAHA